MRRSFLCTPPALHFRLFMPFESRSNRLIPISASPWWMISYVAPIGSGITYLATKTQYLTEGTGQSTVNIPFTPGAVGDLVIVNVSTDVTVAGKPSSIADTAGHIAWAPRVLTAFTSTDPRFITVWGGTGTATGATTIKITWTGGSKGHKELTVTSWRSGHGATTTWSIVGDTSFVLDTPSGKVTVPPLTSSSAPTQFYWCDTIADGWSSGATTHQGVFNFLTDPYSNTYAYRLNLAPNTSYSPKIDYVNDIGIDAIIMRATASKGGTPLPAVTKVSPSSGPTTGGSTVTISGTNLSGATAVKFGTTTATVSADPVTSITATSPSGSAGTVNVRVTTPGGTSAITTADQFTYVAPIGSGITYLATKTQYLTEGTGQSTVNIPFTPGAVGDLVIVNVSTDVTVAGKPSSIADTAGHITWAPRVLTAFTS